MPISLDHSQHDCGWLECGPVYRFSEPADDSTPAPKLEPAESGVTVTATFPAVHQCPFKDESDEGEITIVWTTGMGKTLELHSVREWLDAYDEWTVSHEAYTLSIRNSLAELLGVCVLSVVTHWTTAGGQIEVRA